jgi:hypothetical protein
MTRTQIIADDWAESYIPLSAIVLTTVVFVLVAAWFDPSGDIPKTILVMSGVLCAAVISQRCVDMYDENRLKTLLGPTTKDQLIVTKFVSALSLAVFAVNIPGLVLLDLRFLLNVNAVVLLLTTLLVSANVIELEVPVILFALLVSLLSMPYFWRGDFWLAALDHGEGLLNWVLAHPILCSSVALGAIPFIIAAAVVSRRPMMVHLNLNKE